MHISIKTICETYSAGGASRRLGESYNLNPHHPNSPYAHLWSAGWLAEADESSALFDQCHNKCESAHTPHTHGTPSEP